MTYPRCISGVLVALLLGVLGACAIQASPALAREPALVLLFSSDSKGYYDPCPS
jgi:hypothetical protein